MWMDGQDMNAMLQGVSEGEKQRLMMALEEMQMKEQVTTSVCW
jgi:DNA repair ATPase RecN